jgi:hypothetical protein
MEADERRIVTVKAETVSKAKDKYVVLAIDD